MWRELVLDKRSKGVIAVVMYGRVRGMLASRWMVDRTSNYSRKLVEKIATSLILQLWY